MASYVTIKVFRKLEFTATHFHCRSNNIAAVLYARKTDITHRKNVEKKEKNRHNLWTTHHSELLLANKDNIATHMHTKTWNKKNKKEKKQQRMFACFFFFLLTTFKTYRNISAWLPNWFQLDASVRCAYSFSLTVYGKTVPMEIDIYCIRMCNKVLFGKHWRSAERHTAPPSPSTPRIDMHESKMPASNRIFVNVPIVHIAI